MDSAGHDFGVLQSADWLWRAFEERTTVLDLARRAFGVAFSDRGYRQSAARRDSHPRSKSGEFGGVAEGAVGLVLNRMLATRPQTAAISWRALPSRLQRMSVQHQRSLRCFLISDVRGERVRRQCLEPLLRLREIPLRSED